MPTLELTDTEQDQRNQEKSDSYYRVIRGFNALRGFANTASLGGAATSIIDCIFFERR